MGWVPPIGYRPAQARAEDHRVHHQQRAQVQACAIFLAMGQGAN